MQRAVGEQAQAAAVVAGLAGDLLAQSQPHAVFAGGGRVVVTAQCGISAVAVFVDIAAVGGAVVIAGTVLARQAIDLRRPHHFDGQYRALGATAAELEGVVVFQVRRVLFERSDLYEQFRVELVFDAHRPLADRPVVPDAAAPVAHLRTAQRQVLEVAREGVEILALVESADFHAEGLIEEFLLIPEIGQARDAASAPDFLRGRNGAAARIAHSVVADVVAVAVGQGQLKLGVLPAKNLLQVHVGTQGELVAVTGCLVMVVTAVQVGPDLDDRIDFEVVTLFRQLTTPAAPIPQHPWRSAVERRRSARAGRDSEHRKTEGAGTAEGTRGWGGRMGINRRLRAEDGGVGRGRPGGQKRTLGPRDDALNISADRAGVAHGLIGQVLARDECQPLTPANVEGITRAGAECGVAVGTRFVVGHTPLRGSVFDIDTRLPPVQLPQQSAVQSQRGNPRQGFSGIEVRSAGVIAGQLQRQAAVTAFPQFPVVLCFKPGKPGTHPRVGVFGDAVSIVFAVVVQCTTAAQQADVVGEPAIEHAKTAFVRAVVKAQRQVTGDGFLFRQASITDFVRAGGDVGAIGVELVKRRRAFGIAERGCERPDGRQRIHRPGRDTARRETVRAFGVGEAIVAFVRANRLVPRFDACLVTLVLERGADFAVFDLHVLVIGVAGVELDRGERPREVAHFGGERVVILLHADAHALLGGRTIIGVVIAVGKPCVTIVPRVRTADGAAVLSAIAVAEAVLFVAIFRVACALVSGAGEARNLQVIELTGIGIQVQGESAVARFQLPGAAARGVGPAVAQFARTVDALDGFDGDAIIEGVDHAADGAAAVEQRGGPANDLDALNGQRVAGQHCAGRGQLIAAQRIGGDGLLFKLYRVGRRGEQQCSREGLQAPRSGLGLTGHAALP
nr:hypothetical protein [Tanacetum cinerariifolium]